MARSYTPGYTMIYASLRRAEDILGYMSAAGHSDTRLSRAGSVWEALRLLLESLFHFFTYRHRSRLLHMCVASWLCCIVTE